MTLTRCRAVAAVLHQMGHFFGPGQWPALVRELDRHAI